MNNHSVFIYTEWNYDFVGTLPFLTLSKVWNPYSLSTLGRVVEHKKLLDNISQTITPKTSTEEEEKQTNPQISSILQFLGLISLWMTPTAAESKWFFFFLKNTAKIFLKGCYLWKYSLQPGFASLVLWAVTFKTSQIGGPRMKMTEFFSLGSSNVHVTK